MQPILPTSTDRVSAQVLGFDANAFIFDKPSNLMNTLNINGTQTSNDTFVRNQKARAVNKTKSFFATIGAIALSTVGFFHLFRGKKGTGILSKFKLFKAKSTPKLPKSTFLNKIITGADKIKNGFINKVKGFWKSPKS